jgi:hypothetical protein
MLHTNTSDFEKEIEACRQAISLETQKTSAYTCVSPAILLKPKLCFRAWVVGLHLTKLKEEYKKTECKQNKRKKEKALTWAVVLQENFGGIVGGDILHWANRRMRVYNTYTEEDIELAHMDFTTVYSMLTFSAADRNKWLQIAREKLVTHAMLSENGIYYTHTHTPTPTHTHAHTCTCTHARTHTHAFTLLLSLSFLAHMHARTHMHACTLTLSLFSSL